MAGALPLASDGWTSGGGSTSVGESEPKELPGPGFPGATAAESAQSWPSGRQPERFEAWPRADDGEGKKKLLPCWKTEAIHDVADGWPGKCLGLYHNRRATTLEQCKHYCLTEPRCSVWQFNNQSKTPQCWVGAGLACGYGKGRTGLQVQGGQRLLHGSVRVLMETAGMEIMNLQQLGFFQLGSTDEQIQRCKAFCYSDIACQYWQYGEAGCWVDAPNLLDEGLDSAQTVQYPLTTSGGASRTSERARTMIAGEYIQHYCPPRPAPTFAAPRSALSADPMLGMGVRGGHGGGHVQQVKGILPFLAAAAIALALLCLVPIGYCITQQVWKKTEGRRKGSTKKGRGSSQRGRARLEDEHPLIHCSDAPRGNAGKPVPPPPPPPPALAEEVPVRLSERRGFEVAALSDVEQAQQFPTAPYPASGLPSPRSTAPVPPMPWQPPTAGKESRIWAPPQLGQRPLLLKPPSGQLDAGMPCVQQLRLH